MPELGLSHYRLLLAVLVLLAAVHAYQKLSPYFAMTWFGSALVFGYLWADGRSAPEVVLLPGLVVYSAAATTKGLVESRPKLAGNHLVHVLVTGLLAGLLALPFEATARRLGFGVPRSADGTLFGADAEWFGGAPLDAGLQWSLAGLVFYGVYKLLDHVGIGRSAQTIVLFGSMPLLVLLVERLHELMV